MLIFNKPQEIGAWVRERRGGGARVALVPTMGALHAGHMSLVSLGRELSDATVLYIFVNPAQFNDPSDLEKYPRTLERDLELAKAEGVDAVFAPIARDIYPAGFEPGKTCSVRAGSCALGYEGEGRPGHFDGVCTVLTIMFNIVAPDIAIFGEKDYQQLQVVRQMVRDLRLPLKIAAGRLIRDEDGLALSSRNVRLSESGRREALVLSRSLFAAAAKVKTGEKRAESIEQDVRREVESSGKVRLEYAAVVDADSLERVQHIEKPCRLLLAAVVDGVRLLDNIHLEP